MDTKKAFTLVELLVVIAIISIIMRTYISDHDGAVDERTIRRGPSSCRL
ncbi:type II secretion system protein [Anaerobaca lacustris]|uniref:Prepilin-type N-terminal cleavage/methylation domain-containing protein n=1 Tax=Anaerobaca lacustris TaxID=3044600 RepID=A0AAW6TYL4_9BACT|nr:prepilin-type N-terminal cleavage/methylation domain-containing protein [Sedimentisphaerales bacterium M17dextr]